MTNTSYAAGSGLSKAQVAISGNTYPHRSWLKAQGARWDADNKVWTLRTPTNNKACASLSYELRTRGMSWS